VISRYLTLRSMYGVRFAAAVSLAASSASTPAQSQYAVNERAGIALPIAAVSPSARAGGDTIQTRSPHPLPMRAFIASLGWITGAYIGGQFWYAVRPHDCGCDDPGLEQFFEGAVGGGALGAALGAAAPDLGTSCSFKTRIGRSLLWSIVGSGVGLLANSEAILLTVPILSVTGATLAERRC
jgi:hypothetical protein